ncbi:tetratricopeptide repeat protein [Flammeovirga sp. EKP202]|uniref:tetratricopeptide repeat protein n=1 Tax=Flammeovirga sp. EKP202 TaxID=2770592 RepID=UPI00165EC649|nr:tetratricopeptide repeat protein [Flammeovirga sp. EKP202]MBD0404212.1 tetratricopeptide repeat protein [Flammeovirga sp. EKP202]
MNELIKQKGVYFYLILLFSTSSFAKNDSTNQYIQLYKTVIKHESSKIEELSACYHFFNRQSDSTWTIKSLLGLSDHYARQGNYNESFNQVWEALAIAEQYNHYTLLYEVHKHIGRLYNVFDKEKDAFFHEQQVLKYAQLAIQKKGLPPKSIVSSYYNFILHYRKQENYQKALNYLDTCYTLADQLNYTEKQKVYLNTEKGYIFMLQGRLEEALPILLKAQKHYEKFNPFYLTIIYYYLGNTYIKIKDWPTAEDYFRKALRNIEIRNTHYDTKSECLSGLAFTLNKQLKFEEAYQVMKESKKVNDELFSTKSDQNAGLLAIRNKYREELKERNQLLLQKDNELINQKAKNLQNHILLIILLAACIIIFLVVYLQQKQEMFRSEKQQQRLKVIHQEEKNKELFEIKNKELTSFTLQLIDKETLLNDLIKGIKKYAPENKSLLKIVKQNTTHRVHLWKEFDKRFIDVNKDFYTNLKENFPNLTSTELKHCALIKLHFSAKEMAQLLNISINGVNTSRYRIRKKLQLEREENLSNVIDRY